LQSERPGGVLEPFLRGRLITGTLATERNDWRMTTEASVPVRAAQFTPPPLDYYLVIAQAGRRGPEAQPDGLVVEEFVFAADFSATGLYSAGWGPAERTWWSSAAFGRGMRTDPALRARVVPVSRDDARVAYRRLGGGELPNETTLRTHFHDYQSLAGPAPLRLGSGLVPDGFQDKRVYRILFAKDLDIERLTSLRTLWQLVSVDDPTDPRARVIGTARRRVLDDVFTWDLRRIGAEVAWCLDVTAHLRGDADHTIGPLLRELTAVMRGQGLIPVTVERFS
jgi:hypothetical protein